MQHLFFLFFSCKQELENSLKNQLQSTKDSEEQAHLAALQKLKADMDQVRLSELDMQSTEHRKAMGKS